MSSPWESTTPRVEPAPSPWAAPAEAYARALLDPPSAAAAVHDALRRVRESDDADGALTAVRDAVARRMPAPAPAPARGGFLRRGTPAICPRMPELLAARAASRLSPTDVARIARHLDTCPVCAETEERLAAAEDAFRAALPASGRHVVAAPDPVWLPAQVDVAPAHDEPRAPEPEPVAEVTTGSWLPAGLAPAPAHDDREITISRGAADDADAGVAGNSVWLVGATPEQAAAEPVHTSTSDWTLPESAVATAIPAQPARRADAARRGGSPRGTRIALAAAVVALGAGTAVIASGVLDSSPDASRPGAGTRTAPSAPAPVRAGRQDAAAARRAAAKQRAERKARARRRAAARRKARKPAPKVATAPRPAVSVPVRSTPVVTPVTVAPKPTSKPKPPAATPKPTPARTAPSDAPRPSAPSSDPGRQPPAG